MAAFLDNCRFNPTLGGTTDWTYSSAVAGYQSPAAAGAVNGRLYKYFAIDGSNNWELGEGAYNTAGPVLARTTITANSLGTTAKINFAAAPQVAIVAIKADLLSVEEANSFTSAQKDRASTNLGTVRAIRIQKFTASGTYTPDANLIYADIRCWGGGGGGGGINTNSAQYGGAGGGGAGGRSRKLASAAAIGVSQTVTVGAAGSAGAAGNNAGGTGGDTSVGSLCIAKGGSGGSGSNGAGAIGGVGGVAGTGDETTVGQNGFAGYGGPSNNYSAGGQGANSDLGGGGLTPASSAATTTGAAATGFAAGGGGAGAAFGITTNTTAAGGVGTGGFVEITEYCSQ